MMPMTKKMKYRARKFDAMMTMRVGKGSSAPRLVKSAANVGMTFRRMTATTIIAMAMTAIG